MMTLFSNLLFPQVIKIGRFCSMLWILFSPKVMWIYLFFLFVVPFIIAIPKAAIEVHKERNERFEYPETTTAAKFQPEPEAAQGIRRIY